MRFGQQYLHGKTLHLLFYDAGMLLCVCVRLVVEIKITVIKCNYIHFLVTQNLYMQKNMETHCPLTWRSGEDV